MPIQIAIRTVFIPVSFNASIQIVFFCSSKGFVAWIENCLYELIFNAFCVKTRPFSALVCMSFDCISIQYSTSEVVCWPQSSIAVIKKREPHLICIFISLSKINMKIFKSIRYHFKILGITVNQTRERSSINMKHLFVFFILVVSIVSQIICIKSLAETFEEYTDSIYGMFTLTMTGIEFGIHIWKMERIFKFIENFERLIESSE